VTIAPPGSRISVIHSPAAADPDPLAFPPPLNFEDVTIALTMAVPLPCGKEKNQDYFLIW